MLTHRTLYLHGIYVIAALGSRDTSVDLHTIPLFHANGWGRAHSLTGVAGKHVMIARFDPVEVFRLIERERVENFSVVPAMAIALVNHPAREKHDLSSLQLIMIGGAASSPELVAQVEEKLKCRCIAGYGLTETSPALSLSLPKATIPDWESRRPRLQAMTGYSVLGVELRVADERGCDVPRDGRTAGEILARSDVIMAGYWNQPDETEKALAGGWFHTGDLATWDDEGMILIVDRKKEIIISGGENISSVEVEKVLLAHPAVHEAAVIAVPDEQWGEVPKALIALKPGRQATAEEVMAFARTRLAGYKLPKSIEFVAELPKSGTGKIQKMLLREKYWQHQPKRIH
jgi:fatty-acyl-CoA synthase